jgi:hypothetical protein
MELLQQLTSEYINVIYRHISTDVKVKRSLYICYIRFDDYKTPMYII